LTFHRFTGFLPGGKAIGEFRDLVLLYVGEELRWTLELQLRRREVPRLALSSGLRLGWSSWLGRAARDAGVVRIRDERTTARVSPNDVGIAQGGQSLG
jgi:type VI secretion system protein ImpH